MGNFAEAFPLRRFGAEMDGHTYVFTYDDTNSLRSCIWYYVGRDDLPLTDHQANHMMTAIQELGG